MIKASVRVENIEGLEGQYEDVLAAVDQNLEQVAETVETEAKNSNAFSDLTGSLRRKISKRKSRYEDGGYFVISRAPHSHLIEYGHVKILWGKPTGERVPPHAFLRPALEKGYITALRLFKK